MKKYRCKGDGYCEATPRCEIIVRGGPPVWCLYLGKKPCNWEKICDQQTASDDTQRYLRVADDTQCSACDGEIGACKGCGEMLPKLPDWCKVGNWVWNARTGYFCITEIEGGECVCGRSANGDGQTVLHEPILEAHVRPWTFEEAPIFVKTKNCIEFYPACWHLGRMTKDNEATFFSSNLYSAICEITASDIAEKCVQLNGSPCGVLEHKNEDGEWVG